MHLTYNTRTTDQVHNAFRNSLLSDDARCKFKIILNLFVRKIYERRLYNVMHPNKTEIFFVLNANVFCIHLHRV